MKDFSEKIARLTPHPGVYLMKDENDKIIYVGKAKNLKNRVSSYFTGFESLNRKTQRLVVQIEDFEYIITNSELEALILEAELIKKHRPHFNILLKDDKSFPYLKLTKETFPRLIKTRIIKKDGGNYFGPYTSGLVLNKQMELVKNLFKLRKCNLNMDKRHKKPCLYKHLGLCLAPCVDKSVEEAYNREVESVGLFLKKGSGDLKKILEEEMKEAAEKLNYERAAVIRDELIALSKIKETQAIKDLPYEDADVIALSLEDNLAMVVVLFVRNAKIVDREKYLIVGVEEESQTEIMRQFILQYYSGSAYIPKYIDVMLELSDREELESYLGNRRQSGVQLSQPKRGIRKKLLEMAYLNAKELIERERKEELQKKEEKSALLTQIADLLGLEELPDRIELYDISHSLGSYTVAAMVVFEDGLKKKNDYRKFKVKTVGGVDDYQSLMEVVFRRLNRALAEGEGAGGFEKLPRLMLIDGGRGQVSAVKEVLQALGMNIPVAGLVKDDKHTTRALFYEGREYPLDRHSRLYPFLASMQEEVHRFVIDYHRSLRSKGLVRSELDEIKGLGSARKRALLQKFGSIEAIRSASYDALLETDGLPKAVAENIVKYYSKRNENE